MNKRLLISESRDDSNQYTTCRGKPDTCDMYAFRASPRTPLVGFLRTVPVHGNLLCWPNSIGRTLLLLRKSTPNTVLNTSAGRSVGPPPSFSPNIAIEAVMKAKHLLVTSYVSLLGPYLQHVISTFNTCSRGSTHRSLTNTCGSYNFGGDGLPHHTPQPSQPMVLHFPTKSLAQSQVQQSQHYQLN
jgi:hypothetical protein